MNRPTPMLTGGSFGINWRALDADQLARAEYDIFHYRGAGHVRQVLEPGFRVPYLPETENQLRQRLIEERGGS